jgi:hypothetical protein
VNWLEIARSNLKSASALCACWCPLPPPKGGAFV